MNQDLQMKIQQYLTGQMTEAERLSFEDTLQNDPTMAEYVEFNREMFAEFDENKWNDSPVKNTETVSALKDYFEGDEAKELASKLKDISSQKTEIDQTQKDKPIQDKPRRNRLILPIILLLALLLGVLYLMQQNKKVDKSLYAHFESKTELPGLSTLNEENKLASIEQNYKNSNYKEAIATIHDIPNANSDARLILYRGMSHLQLNEYDRAKAQFSMLSKSDLLDAPKGDWFLILTFLKEGKSDQAKFLADQIKNVPDHPFAKLAEELSINIKLNK